MSATFFIQRLQTFFLFSPRFLRFFYVFLIFISTFITSMLRTILVLNRNEFVAVCTKYSDDVELMMTPSRIKNMIWDNFACTALL